MPSTRAPRRTRSAVGSAAASLGLLLTAACGIGHTTIHHGNDPGPSYARDTAPTMRPDPVSRVRVHGHMGRPAANRGQAVLW
jgi:hypothetical protein